MMSIRDQEISDLCRVLEHAPPPAPPKNPELAGWASPAGTLVCVICAGRVLGRGCKLPFGSMARWTGQGAFVCDCCGSGGAA